MIGISPGNKVKISGCLDLNTTYKQVPHLSSPLHLPLQFSHYSAGGPDHELFSKMFYKTFEMQNNHLKNGDKCQDRYHIRS